MAEYIDREVAIEKIKWLAGITGDPGREYGLKAAIEVLESFPAADVEPVRYGHYKGGCCTVCGWPIATDCWGGGFDSNIYCYHCGAKTDGEALENEP